MREHSAGAVIFRRDGNKILFLLLKSAVGHWEFPKGLVEKNESEKKAVRRETKEEAGINDLIFVGGFKKSIRYFFNVSGKGWRLPKGSRVFKTVNFYLAETRSKNVKISSEHRGFCWVEYEEAMKLLKHRNYKNVLRATHEKLKTTNA